MSKRDIVTNALVTKLQNSILGFSSVLWTIRQPDITQLDHTTFPLCHLVPINEILQRYPNHLVIATLTPLIRCFFQSLSPEQCNVVIANVQLVLADPNLVGANYFTLTSNTILTSPNHLYVEIDFVGQIEYKYKDTEP